MFTDFYSLLMIWVNATKNSEAKKLGSIEDSVVTGLPKIFCGSERIM